MTTANPYPPAQNYRAIADRRDRAAEAARAEEDRQEAIAEAIQLEVLRGGTVVQQSRKFAIVKHDAKVNHMLHLILTIVTGTFWGWVWIGVTIAARRKRRTVRIRYDENLQGVLTEEV